MLVGKTIGGLIDSVFAEANVKHFGSGGGLTGSAFGTKFRRCFITGNIATKDVNLLASESGAIAGIAYDSTFESIFTSAKTNNKTLVLNGSGNKITNSLNGNISASSSLVYGISFGIMDVINSYWIDSQILQILPTMATVFYLIN